MSQSSSESWRLSTFAENDLLRNENMTLRQQYESEIKRLEEEMA
jgi:hypothetical protein